MDAVFNNILDAALGWYPSLDTDEDKVIRVNASRTRGTSNRQKVTKVVSKDECDTIHNIANLMYNGAERRITLTNE